MRPDAILPAALPVAALLALLQAQGAGLDGKAPRGYQGWFTAEGDGAGRGWFHYTMGRGAPRPIDSRRSEGSL